LDPHTGSISEFVFPTGNSGPIGITLGPDGNEWVTESNLDKIGRITIQRTLNAEFTLTTGAHPVGICAAKDGNLYFTEQAVNMMGKITPEGVISTFPIPTGGTTPTTTYLATACAATGPFVAFISGQSNTGLHVGRLYTPDGSIVDDSFAPSPGFKTPSSVVLGPDGNIYATEFDQSIYNANGVSEGAPGHPRILQMKNDGSGTILNEFDVETTTLGSVQVSSEPLGLCSNPDGNIYFTEKFGNKIGKLTLPAGTITYTAVPTGSPGAGSSQPGLITSGPDGNLWFTEQVGNKIGRMTPGGSIVDFPLPTAQAVPFGIATGPDGALWFTEQGSQNAVGKIGRITTAGTITNEYPVPTAIGQPTGITLGPDKNMWFTEKNGDGTVGKIGNITATGTVTEFALPQHVFQDTHTPKTISPDQIVLGADHALWFSELTVGNDPTSSETTNGLGRITFDGKTIQEFNIPTDDAGASGICTGNKRQILYTDANANKIGSFKF